MGGDTNFLGCVATAKVCSQKVFLKKIAQIFIAKQPSNRGLIESTLVNRNVAKGYLSTSYAVNPSNH